MSTSQSLPTPSDCYRDHDGRLTEAIVRSAAAIPNQNSWLVAVDGSADSLEAINQAIHLSLKMHSNGIILVHVHPWMSKEAAETDLLKLAWQTTESARNAIEQAGLQWQLHAAMGRCAEKIVDIAQQQECYGIVIGSRGLSATHSLLLGSTAYKVIHLAHQPVMVSKRNAPN